MRDHGDKVRCLAGEIQLRARNGEPVFIAKGGVSHFVPLPGDRRRRGRPIDISDLDQILEIDPERRICHAEPGVTFAQLARATLAQGLLPMVVPELEGITLGGAVAGCSVESMSYRYGGFHDTCLEYELVTGDGRVLACSREREPLAFEMVHGSYGTLAVLTRLAFQLVPALSYVRLEYRRFASFVDFEAELRVCCLANDFDFIDGIIHGPDLFVLCLGRFVDRAPYVSDYRWLNVYYKSTRERGEDYLTTFDYCFRYDTECHWLSRTVPGLESKLVRLALGKLVLGSTNLIRWSKRLDRVREAAGFMGGARRPDVVCDVFIPAERFGEFFEWYARDFDFYPLWVIPYRVPRIYGWVSERMAAGMSGDLFIDCAVYGKPNRRRDLDYSKLLERRTYELGGLKTLISRNHYTRERFWEIYNRGNYERAKRELDPLGVFPGLYEKFMEEGDYAG